MNASPSTTSINRSEVFKKEVALIQSLQVRKMVLDILENVPEYFFHIPASSTGKYHPAYALGEGGLVRHVRAAVWIAQEMFNMDPPEAWNRDERDIVIATLILHDCMKNGDGKDKYTVTEHPILMATMVDNYRSGAETFGIDLPDWVVGIPMCIRSHMGRWTSNPKTNEEVLPKPVTKLEKFVHLCDYIASRRCLEFNFATVGG